MIVSMTFRFPLEHIPPRELYGGRVSEIGPFVVYLSLVS